MKVAIVGATGLVGQKMLQVLGERKFPAREIIPVATARSAGREVRFNNRNFRVMEAKKAVLLDPDIALFSAGGGTSLEWAPRFAQAGSYVIDNSSAWRMDPGKKLIVPEINAGILTMDDRIIANPNCSTIQLVMVLAPLHRAFGIRRVVVSTYQSVTGSGMKAIDQMNTERAGGVPDRFYPHPIDGNVIPHCDVFVDGGYTKEEMKLVNETRKILDDDRIAITATTVRVPVTGGHSESVNIEFDSPADITEVRRLLQDTAGVVVMDDPANNLYPMPLTAIDRDEVFVGRIRRDNSVKHGINLWIVADNLRKGAATNAVQIAEYVAERFL